jgi:hypothetical protein
MKLLSIAAVLLLLCASVRAYSQAQSTPSNPQQTQDAPQSIGATDKAAAQRRYDPLAGREHLRGGIWDTALGNVNPDNVDYGERLDAWRRVIMGETIYNAVFWTAVVMSSSLLFAIVYIYWMHRDRALRLDISVNILTQISNAYIDARDHALDAIAKHNQLADDYNAMAEKLAALEQQKAENQRRVRTSAPDQSFPDSNSENVSPAHPVDDSPRQPEPDAEESARLQREADAQAGRRFAQQISALQEKNKTLRLSLNEAIAENDRLKRSNTELAGA